MNIYCNTILSSLFCLLTVLSIVFYRSVSVSLLGCQTYLPLEQYNDSQSHCQLIILIQHYIMFFGPYTFAYILSLFYVHSVHNVYNLLFYVIVDHMRD